MSLHDFVGVRAHFAIALAKWLPGEVRTMDPLGISKVGIMKLKTILAAILTVVSPIFGAEAAQINFSLTGAASGVLGTQVFTDQTITFSGISDTTTVMPTSYFTTDLASATLMIGSLASVQILNSVFLVSNTFSDNVGLSYYSAETGAAGGSLLSAIVGDGSYVLTTDYGPASGPASTYLSATVHTSGGDLSYVLSSATATYTARIATDTPPAGAVPEPASWAMMILGFGLTGARMRYRKRRSAVSYR